MSIQTGTCEICGATLLTAGCPNQADYGHEVRNALVELATAVGRMAFRHDQARAVLVRLATALDNLASLDRLSPDRRQECRELADLAHKQAMAMSPPALPPAEAAAAGGSPQVPNAKCQVPSPEGKPAEAAAAGGSPQVPNAKCQVPSPEGKPAEACGEGGCPWLAPTTSGSASRPAASCGSAARWTSSSSRRTAAAGPVHHHAVLVGEQIPSLQCFVGAGRWIGREHARVGPVRGRTLRP